MVIFALNIYPMRKFCLFFLFASFFVVASSQSSKKGKLPEAEKADSIVMSMAKYRLVGPFRGGRSACNVGMGSLPGKPKDRWS